MGHSWGGRIGAEFALRNPNLVDKLVLLDVTTHRQSDEEMKRQSTYIYLKKMSKMDLSQLEYDQIKRRLLEIT